MDKDSMAISILDEAIQLWNSMWSADQIHDQQIAKNVKTMQSRCQTLLGDLYDAIEQLAPMEVVAQRLKKLEAAAPPQEMAPR